MSKSKNQAKAGSVRRSSDDEDNCFASSSFEQEPVPQRRVSIPSQGAPTNSINLPIHMLSASSLNNLSYAHQSYVESIMNKNANVNPLNSPPLTPNVNNVNKPQLIDALARMKFMRQQGSNMQSPNSGSSTGNMSEFTSFSYENLMNKSVPSQGNQQNFSPQPSTQTMRRNTVQAKQQQMGSMNSTGLELPSFSLLSSSNSSSPYALPSIRVNDSSNNRVPIFKDLKDYREDYASIPYIPSFIESNHQAMPQSPQISQGLNMQMQFNITNGNNSTSSSQNLPSWFDEEKSRYLGRQV
jgi:hypothetical protein